MKTLVLALILSVTPDVASRIWVNRARAGEPQAQSQVIVAKAAPAAKSQSQSGNMVWTAKPVVVTVNPQDGQTNTNDGADANSNVYVYSVVASADDQAGGRGAGAEGKNPVKVFVKRVGNEDEAAASKGWLGVTIVEAPDALAEQLSLNGNGVVIANVAKGSPADSAGIQKNDIILSINGKEVGSTVGSAVDLIRAQNPGDKLNVVVLRNGQQQNLSATLAQRPDMSQQKIEWKFEGPEGTMQERTTTHGKMIMRGPNGTWTMQNLGDLSNLPPGVAQLIPHSGSKQVQVTSENGQRNISIKVENDGGTLTVEQKDGDAINVTRTDSAGKTTNATYADADALRKADPEAADMYDQIGSNVIVNLNDGEDGNTEINVDMSDLHNQIMQGLGAAHESYQKAMEDLRKAIEEMQSKGAMNADALKALMDQHGGLPRAFAFDTGKPKQSFEVRPDGTIEVHIRKGDSEVVKLYQNEADLAKRNPEMAKKYNEVNSSGRE